MTQRMLDVFWLAAIWISCCAVPSVFAWVEPVGESKDVVAEVNGTPVTRAEVQSLFQQTFGNRKLSDKNRDRLRTEILEKLIDRRLVLEYLAVKKLAAKPVEIDLHIKRLKIRLGQREMRLDDYLDRSKITLSQFRQELAWQMSWSRHVRREITGEALQAFFKQNRRDYDGAQLHVRQILLKWSGPPDDVKRKTLLDRATGIREDIVAGKIAFAAAARQFSDAPSGKKGGDQGWIKRHGQNIEAFSRVAFALQKGETSAPFATQFGVHLIQCVEVKQGSQQWSDVREQLTRAAVADLFKRLAKQQRKTARVKYQNR